MPRPRGKYKGVTTWFTIRLDDETAAFYRTKANEHGLSVSEFLRHLLLRGVIAETVSEVEASIRAAIAEIPKANGAAHGGLSESALLSLYTSEELLKAVVEAKDIQTLYRAQDRAKARLAAEGKG